MKVGYSDSKNKIKEEFGVFHRLWRLDDESWLKQREHCWELQYGTELQTPDECFYRKYYVYGE